MTERRNNRSTAVAIGIGVLLFAVVGILLGVDVRAPDPVEHADREAPVAAAGPEPHELVPEDTSQHAETQVVPLSEGATLVVRCALEHRVVAFVTSGTTRESETVRDEVTQGQAELWIPDGWFEAADPIEVLAGIAGPGIVKTIVEVELRRGSRSEITLDPPPGLELSGRVIDTAGEPVIGIEVIAHTTTMSDVRQPGTFRTAERLGSGRPYEEARAVTEPDGSFVLTGLSERAYSLNTSSMDWAIVSTSLPPPFLRTKDGRLLKLPLASSLRATPPRTGIELVACRSYRLRLKLQDADTALGVPTASVQISGETAERAITFWAECEDGEGIVCWAPRGPAMRDGTGFELDVETKALGYLPAKRTVRFDPGEHDVSTEIRLTPSGMGWIVFEILGADPTPRWDSLSAVIGPPGVTSRHGIRLVPGPDPRTYRCRAPVGTMEVYLRPHEALSNRSFGWAGTVEVPENGAARAEVTFPPFGSLLLENETGEAVKIRFRIQGVPVTTLVTERRQRFAVVPQGTWPFSASRDGVEFLSGFVVVQDGEDARLVLH